MLHSQEIVDLIHKLQPNCLVNNRLDEQRADYGTPEQKIPDSALAKPFEVCITINGHLGYNKADHNFKSAQDLIRKLVDITSEGGNFLLNVGPTSEGASWWLAAFANCEWWDRYSF